MYVYTSIESNCIAPVLPHRCYFSKDSSTIIESSTLSSKQTFENFCQHAVPTASALKPSWNPAGVEPGN